MLQINHQPLSPPRLQSLRELLSRHDSLVVLKQVVESKALTLEFQAVNDLAQTGDYAAFSENAKGSIVKAQRYRHFLSVLDEIIADNDLKTIHLKSAIL